MAVVGIENITSDYPNDPDIDSVTYITFFFQSLFPIPLGIRRGGWASNTNKARPAWGEPCSRLVLQRLLAQFEIRLLLAAADIAVLVMHTVHALQP